MKIRNFITLIGWSAFSATLPIGSYFCVLILYGLETTGQLFTSIATAQTLSLIIRFGQQNRAFENGVKELNLQESSFSQFLTIPLIIAITILILIFGSSFVQRYISWPEFFCAFLLAWKYLYTEYQKGNENLLPAILLDNIIPTLLFIIICILNYYSKSLELNLLHIYTCSLLIPAVSFFHIISKKSNIKKRGIPIGLNRHSMAEQVFDGHRNLIINFMTDGLFASLPILVVASTLGFEAAAIMTLAVRCGSLVPRLARYVEAPLLEVVINNNGISQIVQTYLKYAMRFAMLGCLLLLGHTLVFFTPIVDLLQIPDESYWPTLLLLISRIISTLTGPHQRGLIFLRQQKFVFITIGYATFFWVASVFIFQLTKNINIFVVCLSLILIFHSWVSCIRLLQNRN